MSPDQNVGLEFPTALDKQDTTDLQAAVDPTDPSDSHGQEIYCHCLQNSLVGSCHVGKTEHELLCHVDV